MALVLFQISLYLILKPKQTCLTTVNILLLKLKLLSVKLEFPVEASFRKPAEKAAHDEICRED